MNVLTFDCETTTWNKGHVFDPRNFLVSYSIKENNEPTSFHYYQEPDFLTILKDALSSCDMVVGFNIKFDLHWIKRVGLAYVGAVYDCSLAEFIVSGQKAVMVSLDDTLTSYELPKKQDVVKEFWDKGFNTHEIPVEVLEEYNNLDADLTYQLYLLQLQLLSEKQMNLVMLEGQDMLTLIEAEANGQLWDREEGTKALAVYMKEIDATKEKLWTYVPAEARKWFNWDSGDDLSALLYGGIRTYADCTTEEAIYKSGEKVGQPYIKRSWFDVHIPFPQRFNPLKNTSLAKCQKPGYPGTMFYQVDEPTLKQLKTKNKENKQLLLFLHSVSKIGKIVEMLEELFKISETMNWGGNLLHGQFNQNVVATGRLSSSKPNMQNKPEQVDKFLISRFAC